MPDGTAPDTGKGGEAHMKKKIIAAAVAIGVLAGFLIWKNREM